MKPRELSGRSTELGRIVLPVECRRVMEIEDKDALEVFVEDNTIILKKYEPACIFCGESRDVVTFKGRNVCPVCAKSLAKRYADD